MADSSGNMSIDFLAGFTIFIVAFIWVATMIPGLLIGLSAHAIDYDAVAYRSAVILTEDPGVSADPDVPWEQYDASGTPQVERLGLAITKDTPNILSRKKIERFFSGDFVYPEDFRQKLIFGDYPYRFNISLLENGQVINQTGEPLPVDHSYGFIRREVKIKGHSNATLDTKDYKDFNLTNKYQNGGTLNNLDVNATTHDFSIRINRTELLHGNVSNPPFNPTLDAAHYIDPRREWIIINLTNFTEISRPPLPDWVGPGPATNAALTSIQLYGIRLSQTTSETETPVDMAGYEPKDFLYITDSGGDTPVTTYPVDVRDKQISMMFKPGYFGADPDDNWGSIYINMTFVVDANCGPCSPSRLSTGFPFLNTSAAEPWNYSYNKTYITQPELTDAVVEVAVW